MPSSIPTDSPLSPAEDALYQAVTDYVRSEMNRAERLKETGEGRRGNTVGFALTVLQRRLASSPEAILRSLQRRRDRLTVRLTEMHSLAGAETIEALPDHADVDDALDELAAEELEALEEQVVDAATAARTAVELKVEIGVLDDLVHQARQVRHAGEDRKWNELRDLLLEEEAMFDADGRRRKILVFTEHRDTLTYLVERITSLLAPWRRRCALRPGPT